MIDWLKLLGAILILIGCSGLSGWFLETKGR